MSVFYLPRAVAFDTNSNRISGAKLNFYTAGTDTRKDTYSDSALTTANSNPVVADSTGLFGAIYMESGAYKVVLTDSSDVTLWTQDNVSAGVDGLTYNLGSSSAADRTAEERLKDRKSVKDVGAVGDGSTDDSTAIGNAMDDDIAWFPEGNYRISADTTLASDDLIRFDRGAYITIDSGVTLTVNGDIDCGRLWIFRGSGSVVFGSSFKGVVYPEWIGVRTEHTAATNTSYWNAFIQALGYQNHLSVDFGRGTYAFTAPFYLRQRMTIEGKGFFATTFDLSGSNEHGMECVFVNSDGDVTRDTAMEGSCVYAFLRDVYVDCTDMTFTSSAKRFMFYGAALSSSLIERNRFGSPSTSTNQMDGIFLGPSRADESSDPGLHHAANRSVIRDNRLSNYRDGIVLGRTDATWSTAEPASGGAGDLIGGDVYENEVYGNYFAGCPVLGAQSRITCRINYYDDSAGTVSAARPKPYSNSIYDNSFEHGGTVVNLTGTLAVTNGSTAVTGTGTLFSTELPTPSASYPVAIRLSDGSSSYTVQVASIASATSLTLSSNWSGNTASGRTATSRYGAAVYCGAKGRNNRIRDNYIDEGVYSVWVGANASHTVVEDNHSGGSPLEQVQDDSAYDAGVVVRHIKGEGSEDNELTIASGAITLPARDARIGAYKVDTESDASTDDLDTITGGKADDLLTFTAANDARTVVFKDGTGNLRLSADFSLDSGQDTITLRKDRDSGNWYQVATANNGT